MSRAVTRLAGPVRSAISSQRLPLIRQCTSTRQAYRWRGERLTRAFSARTILQEKKYTEDHEWIELDAEGKIGTIGITEYASNALGDVVFVELPELDLEVSKGDSIGAVESVKSASDIMTPVSGKIVEANSLLEEKPGTINKGPEKEGWLAKIELSNAAELEKLMSKEEYDASVKE